LLIDPAINYKIAVVARDPRESGYRRVLNFGHTIGHALESFFQQRDALSILHGDAIAAGMLSESYLSMKVLKMPSHSFSKISSFIVRNFPPCHLDKKEVGPLIDLMLYDKKNKGGEICFTLLEDIGRPMVDVYCSPEVIRTSLEYYREVMAY
jgi:3-dehydroquinate synthase